MFGKSTHYSNGKSSHYYEGQKKLYLGGSDVYKRL